MKQLYIALIAVFLAIPQDLSAQWTQSVTMEGGSIIDDVVEYNGSIYIAVNKVGVYRSSDNGATWEATSVPMQGDIGNFVVVDEELFVLYADRSYRTSDGVNFTETTAIGYFVNDVATDGTTLVAGGLAGIYISDDKGLSWPKVADEKIQGDILAVAVRGDVILASGRTKPGILFRSTDLGANWEEINAGSHIVAELVYQGTTLFMSVSEVGVFRSPDDGVTWQQVRSHTDEGDIAVTPTHIFHVSRGDYATSANQGDSWAEVLDGPPSGFSVQSLFAGTSYIFAGTWGGGVYRKPLDDSAPWASCNTGLSFYTMLDLDIRNDDILAGGDWAFVMNSTDGGQTWARSTDHLAVLNGNAIVRLGNDIFVAAGSIYRSNDGGSTWVKKDANLPAGYASALEEFKGKLYTEVNEEIYVSSDGGESWMKKSEGFTGTVRTLFADDNDLFVGAFQGLFRLSSDEQQWEKIDIGIGETQSIGHIARLGTILLVADQYTGIYKSTNDGETWMNINNNTVQSLAVRNNEIYAGATSGPLYHSLDSGATWSDIKANLPSSRFVSTIGFTLKHVVVGVPYRGLWLRPIGEVAPPYFSFPSTLTDSTFHMDEPIVIHVDQTMQTTDGTPIPQGDVDDLVTVTTADGTPVNYSAILDEDLSDITVTIDGMHDSTVYQITIAPVANPEGLETKAQSFAMRAVANVPPSITDISIEVPKNTIYQFAPGEFTAKYSDYEGAALAKIKVVGLPSHGTLTVGGNAVAVDAEVSLAELSSLSYTPDADFVGSDQWDYYASDGTSYSNSAHVTVTVSPVTGIGNEGFLSKITYYPNPVDKMLMIRNPSPRGIDWFSVMDLNGRTLGLPQERNDGTVMIDFTGVPAGVYVLSVRSEGKRHYYKVLRR